MKRLLSRAGVGAMLPVFAMPVVAQHDEDLMREFEECRELDDDDKRLICYDRIGEALPVIATTTAEDVQVWKYMGRRQLKYRDCSGAVDIKEDRFGFALQIEGDTRSVRVARVK